MHIETPRGFTDVPIAKLIDPLDMLPAYAVGRHRIFRRRRAFAGLGEERFFHIIGISRFWEIIDGAGFLRRRQPLRYYRNPSA
jgi:hypothetical protein